MNRTYNKILFKKYKVALQSESTITTKIIKAKIKKKNKKQGMGLDAF